MDKELRIEHLLSKEFCDKLVQSSSLTIGCNVLITDEKGYVISSDDKSREGLLHEASLEVMETKQKAYHDKSAAEKLAGTRPGMTIPLIVNDRVVGTIGVTGSPETISKYAELIQQMSEIFLSFQSRQPARLGVDSQNQALLREIITFSEGLSSPSAVYEMAYDMGIDLNVPRTVIFIHLSGREPDIPADRYATGHKLAKQELRKLFTDPQEIILPQNDTDCVILATLPPGEGMERGRLLLPVCRQVEGELPGKGQKVYIGIGRDARSLDDLHKSYQDARFAVSVSRSGVREEKILSIFDLPLERLASSLSDDFCEELESVIYHRIAETPQYEEIMKLVGAWCRSRFHATRTADMLHIHRSTLEYRFERLREIFGLDLHDYDRATAILLLDIHHRLKKYMDSSDFHDQEAN